MTGLFSRLARKLAGPPAAAADVPAPGSSLETSTMIGEALGLVHAGRAGEAAAIYQRVLAHDPSNFDALHMQGALAHQAGDGARAVQLIERAIEVRPDDASARNNLGLVYRSLGRLDEAEDVLRRAVQLNPASDRVHASLGVVLRDRGDLAGAEAELKEAVQRNPGNDEALSNLANVCKELHRHDEAELHLRAALALRPGRAEYWSNLAGLHLERAQWQDAESCLRAVVEMGAASAATHSDLGFALLQLDRPDEAEAACREALALREEFPDALVNLASVLKELGDLAGAEASCSRALAIDPGHVAALVNLATLRKEQGDAPAALELCRRALAYAPGSPAARFNLSTMLLMRGEYAEGFALTEGRFETFRSYFRRPHMERLLRDDGRRWRGDPIAGLRLVVWAEQGHGDNLMMMRYLPLIKRQGAAHITFVCDPELVRIAEVVEGVDTVITGDAYDAGQSYDLHCPTMSLPYCLQTTLATVPAPPSYIAVPRSLADEWSTRVAGIVHPRVGLVWAGNQVLRVHARRSMSLAAMSPLRNVAGLQFFSLQKGEHAAEAGEWGSSLIDHMDACRDFMDTAALIDNLDLVVTIDTAVAHLAGAMGKPVWLLNRVESDWRWGTSGERCAWYPSMRIFRQEQPLDWVPVMQAITGQLADLVGRTRNAGAPPALI